MVTTATKARAKRLPKGKRIHARRVKQLARRTGAGPR